MIYWLKQRFLAQPLRFMAIAYGIYMICFFTLDNWDRSSYTLIYSSLDDLIPFNVHAVYLYIAWFPMMVVPILKFFHKKNWEDLWNFIGPMLMAMFCALIIYVFFPNGLNLRPQVIDGNCLAAQLTRLIEGADTPNNVCPSIHVATTLLMDYSLQTSRTFKNKGFLPRLLIHALTIGICIAVLVLKQHSILDVLWGGVEALAVGLFWFHFNC